MVNEVETSVSGSSGYYQRPALGSRFRFHQGEALLHLANTYPDLGDVVVECVQNAIDANARRVWVRIDYKKRILTVTDNGDGKSKAEFDEALMSVCHSGKDRGKLGRFGIGLIAPLGKCERFTFTSTTAERPRGYIEWTFVTEDIRRSHQIDRIPYQFVREYVFSDSPHNGPGEVHWRTMVKLERFTEDQIISRITMERLKDEIVQKFGAIMRRSGIIVSVRIQEEGATERCGDIVAEPYSGKKIPDVVLPHPVAGDSHFRLYLTKRTEKGRKGKVVVGEVNDDYRVNFSSFCRTGQKWLEPEVVAAFSSGIFEGEVLSTNARLHAGRKGFEENERLAGFCATLNTWFREQGQKLYAEAKEERQEARYQELGLKSLKRIEDLLKRPEMAGLMDTIRMFKRGTIGAGHCQPEDRKVLGKQETPSLALDGSRKPSPSSGNTPRIDRERSEPGHDKPKHSPMSVLGPHGRKRIVVRSDSVGLQYLPEVMEGSDRAWDLDRTNGILRFNTRHPNWERCEKSNDALGRYMDYVAVQALVLMSLPEEWKVSDLPRRMFDELLRPFSFLVAAGEAVRAKKAE